MCAFNKATNELRFSDADEGVIVQARRYVAYKKVNLDKHNKSVSTIVDAK